MTQAAFSPTALGHAGADLSWASLVMYANLAFSVWMVMDAARRKAAFYWYFIILFMPLGAVLYFFLVKSGRPGPTRRPEPKATPLATPTPEELELLAKDVPSAHNRVLWADALVEHERYAEAVPVYAALLERYPEDKAVLHGIARAYLGQGMPEAAREALEKLLDLDKTYRDYRPALDYAEALWQSERKSDAVELLQGLVSESPRIYHRVALAHYLASLARHADARGELEAALKDYVEAPDYIQNRDQVWAERARRMLVQLPNTHPT